jgi:hypothetical protein
MAILLLVGASNFRRSGNTLMELKGFGIAHWILAKAGPATNAQILASRHLKINIDGFNRQRDMEIAKDSRNCFDKPLPSKRNWNRNPSQKASSAAVSARERLKSWQVMGAKDAKVS